VHDVAVQNLPVRFAIDRAGLVGADGATHAGVYDLAYLSCLPNMVIMCPSDEAELVHMVATAAAYDDGPSALRYPRGEGVGCAIPDAGEVLAIGKGRLLREGNDIAILSLGTRLGAAIEAADRLDGDGISATIADARFAKPLDLALIDQLATNHKALLIVEEGSPGGFAAHVMTYLGNAGHLDGGLKARALCLPDVFIDHDSQQGQLAFAGLDCDGIYAAARKVIPKSSAKSAAPKAKETSGGRS
jgi:1-deoxy-D-xylulose-5-phosphate synthase